MEKDIEVCINYMCYKLDLPLKHTIIMSLIEPTFDMDDYIGRYIENGIQISNKQIARYLRTNKYEVSRILSWLHKNGYIDFYGKTTQRKLRRGKRYYDELYPKCKELINPTILYLKEKTKREKGWY